MKRIQSMLLRSIMLFMACTVIATAGEVATTPEVAIKFKSESLPVVSFKQYTDKVKCSFGTTEVKAKRVEEKRKYKIGDKVYKAKRKENKIKVYDASGKLLWKAKVTDTKMKISKTEDGAPLYSVKIKDRKYKVLRGETLIASVKQSEDKSSVKIVNAVEQRLYKSKTSSFSIGFAVIAMKDIPEEQRAIILSELYLAGF